MDTIEHGMYLNQRPELLEADGGRAGRSWCPTLSGYYWMGGFGDAIDPASGDRRRPDAPEHRGAGPPQPASRARAACAPRVEAGVKIALGSDRDGVSGEDTALELVRMVHHGLTGAEALRSATSVAAEAIGLQDHIGTSRPGGSPTCVVVDGDAVPHPSCCSIRNGSGWCSSSARSSAAPALEVAAPI